MTSQSGSTGVDSKKQQRLKTVQLGAFAKIVVCLVINIFQRERAKPRNLNCRGKSVRRRGEQEMWNTVLAEHLSSYGMMCLPVRLTHINNPLTSERETVGGGRERGTP